MSLKSLSIDQGQRMVRLSPCCNSIFLAIFDEMWFLTTGPMVIIPSDLGRVFRSERELPAYLREVLLSRTNPIL